MDGKLFLSITVKKNQWQKMKIAKMYQITPV